MEKTNSTLKPKLSFMGTFNSPISRTDIVYERATKTGICAPMQVTEVYNQSNAMRY